MVGVQVLADSWWGGAAKVVACVGGAEVLA